MASNVVRVEQAQAQSGKNQFDAKLSEMKRKVAAMRTLVNETSQWWEGDTGTTFRASFERACTYFENTLTKKLQDHAQRMLESVNAQHTQDSNMAPQIKRF